MLQMNKPIMILYFDFRSVTVMTSDKSETLIFADKSEVALNKDWVQTTNMTLYRNVDSL